MQLGDSINIETSINYTESLLDLIQLISLIVY